MFYFIADSFLLFAAGVAWYACSIALFSGTKEALIYDSARELGKEAESLQKLGRSQNPEIIRNMLTKSEVTSGSTMAVTLRPLTNGVSNVFVAKLFDAISNSTGDF